MKPILISAGHGGNDPGAVANGLKEADVCLEFRDMVAHYLTQAGVAFTRDGAKGENLTLNQAVRLMPSRGIAVEFHLNASDNSSATGVETLSQPKDFELGNEICEAVHNRLMIRNRGAKPEGSGQHSRLAFVRAGGIIVELFFVTNKDDVKAYESAKWVAAKDIAALLIKEAKK